MRHSITLILLFFSLFSSSHEMSKSVIKNGIKYIIYYDDSGHGQTPICAYIQKNEDAAYSGNFVIPQSIVDNLKKLNNDRDGYVDYTASFEVRGITENAFNNCEDLISVFLPSSISGVAKGAFSGCSNLESIIIDEDNKYFETRDNCNAIITKGHDDVKYNDILVAGCKNTFIPISVVKIADNAFDGCSGLQTMIIPNSVLSIGKEAFKDCSGLTEVICQAKPDITQTTFDNSANNATLYVRDSDIEAFKVNTYWNHFKEILPIEKITDFLIPFREAYISDEKLKSIIDEYETPREVEILERLPIKADVKSGDFGEILSFYLACAIWAPTVNVMPMKWRFKDKKDAPSHYTDIVLFKLGDPSDPTKMSANDAMITFEVKTKATKLGNQTYPTHKRKSYITYKDGRLECTILEAVFDANKDAVERAAETIPYLKTRCKDLGLKILHDQIDRFSKAISVTYKKEHNAVAIVDSAHLADQIGRVPVDLLAQHPLVKTVYCLPIENLKTIYERVFSEMPKKA